MLNEKDIILDSISDGVFTVDSDWRITSFNRAAEKITDITRDEAIGQQCSYVLRASVCGNDCALRHTMETGQPLVNLPIYILRADGSRVPISISTALLKSGDGAIIGGVETFRDLSREDELKRELTRQYTFADITSRNHRMQELFGLLPTIAESSSTILVEGESGTGKELVCRAIHSLSPRKDGPFIAVNCGALPDTLLESELFGYKAGAFSDARSDKKGRFELADGGTILLDEIGDISPSFQVRLLRVLQERTFEPLGSEQSVTVDVRILVSTNRRLDDMLEEGTFRRDLYYRINVVHVEIPPLRERREDIPLLIEHFIRHFNRLNGRDISGFHTTAMEALMGHDYPGNVRELENAIEHAFVLCRDRTILPKHLPGQFRHDDVGEGKTVAGSGTMEELEITAIRDALGRHDNNRTKAARALGIHKTTLHRKLRKYNITIPRKRSL